jgi:hypothetical protein
MKLNEAQIDQYGMPDHKPEEMTADRHPDRPAVNPPVCAECDGRGKILDAPDRVLDGHPYWVPCPVCQRGV